MAESTQKKKPKSSATRAQSVSAARAKETPEERQDKARKAALSGTPEERSARARKAAQASAEKRRAAKEAERRRAEAARKGWETRRRENPEKYGPQKKKPTKAQQKAARSAAAKKGWETRRVKEAERADLAARYREQLERNRRQWSSDLVYVISPGRTNVGSWAREAVDVAVLDAQSAGANPLAGPWRVAGAVEGAQNGADAFDVTVQGTLHERAAALAYVLTESSKRGGVFEDRSPQRKGAGSSGSGRGARALDEAAEAARQAAIAEFTDAAKPPEQAARVTTLIAPVDADVWRAYGPQDDDDDGGGFDDDEEIPF